MRFVKKLIIGLLLSIVILFGALFAFSWFYGDFIAQTVIKQINKNIQSEVSVEKVKFSIFKKFPNATIRLTNVVAKNKRGFFTRSKKEKLSDTLFYAQNLYINLNLWDLIHKKYIIEEFEVDHSFINLYYSEFDDDNFNIFTTGNDSTNSAYLQLNKIKIHDSYVTYIDLKAKQKVRGKIEKSLISGFNKNQQLDIKLKTELTLHQLQFDDIRINNETEISINTACRWSSDTLIINSGSVVVNDNNIILLGHLYTGYINISLSGNDLDLSKINTFMPRKYSKDLNIEGLASINMFIKGKYSKTKSPDFFMSFKSGGAKLLYLPLNIEGTFEALNFDISSSKGITNMLVNECIVNTGNSKLQLKGKAKYEDRFSYKFTSVCQIDLQDFSKFKMPANIDELSGTIESNLNITGSWNPSDSTISVLFDNNEIKGDITLNNLIFKHINNDYSFSNLSGNIQLEELLTSKNIELIYKHNTLKANISIPFTNIIDQSFNNFNIDIYSNTLNIDSLLGGPKTTSSAFKVNQYRGKISIVADKLLYQNLVFEKLNSRVNFTNQGIHFEKLQFKTLNGSVDAEASIAQSGILHNYTLSSNLQKIDISQLFKTFNNFGQQTLRYSHLKGLYSGTVSMKFSMDSLFNIKDKSIELESTMEIDNGELLGFEPMMELSKFIKVEDLKNIRFASLKNNIRIKNRVVNIPRMDIASNALNLSLYGFHDFDNNFEYHIRLLLSDVLFNKFKNTESNKNANIAERDSRGQIYLYYVIKGNTDNFKVSYDARNAKEQFKKNLLNEKNLLKDLIKSEFGGFRNDSLIAPTPPKKIAIEQDEIIEPAEKTIKTEEKPLKTETKKVAKPKIEWKDE